MMKARSHDIVGDISMKKTIRTLTVIATVITILFTSLPMLTGEFTAHAVSTPRKVTTFNGQTYSSTSVRLTWKKAGSPSGYGIFVNGKLKKSLSNKNTAYNVPKLKPATTYKFTIRAYNTYKQKQYYNSKTKKWQTKKPAASQWKGKKTRKVNARKYGPTSVARSVSTGPAKISGIKVTDITHNSFRLSWNKQSKSCTGYVVYNNGKQLARLGAGNTNYKIKDLSANTKYSYKVCSYMKVGSKNVYGPAVSGTVTTTVNSGKINSNTGGSINNDFNVRMPNEPQTISAKNNQIQINASSISPITWTSSDNSVATVKENSVGARVTFHKVGTVTITASAIINGKTQSRSATYTLESFEIVDTPNIDPEGKTFNEVIIEWADANITGGHTDAYIVYKAFLGVEAMHLIYSNEYFSCGLDSYILETICKRNGVSASSRSCSGDGIYYNPTNSDAHINNLVKINGTYYVVDGGIAIIMYYDSASGHPTGGKSAASGAPYAYKNAWKALGMTDAEINELGIPD